MSSSEDRGDGGSSAAVVARGARGRGRCATLRGEVLWAAGFAGAPCGLRETYRVAQVLGRGAMGEVLAVRVLPEGTTAGRAAPLRLDDELYALKVLAAPAAPAASGGTRSLAPGLRGFDDAAGLADGVAVERAAGSEALASLLRREATKQELARRHGVAVARLFALVRLDDGSLGLRMERARGRSLEQWVRREGLRREGPPAAGFALLVARRLLGQLRRLHALEDAAAPEGFVHSDVKPGNVFVDASEPGDPQLTLLDFGVASGRGARAEGLLVEAAAGAQSVVFEHAGGTLGYAPPGHFAAPACVASDVFAALVVLYELLALELPWEAGATPWELTHLAALEEAMRAGPRPLRASRPSTPAALAAPLDAFFAREFAELEALVRGYAQAEQRGEGLAQRRVQRAMDLAGLRIERLEDLERTLRTHGGEHFLEARSSVAPARAPALRLVARPATLRARAAPPPPDARTLPASASASASEAGAAAHAGCPAGDARDEGSAAPTRPLGHRSGDPLPRALDDAAPVPLLRRAGAAPAPRALPSLAPPPLELDARSETRVRARPRGRGSRAPGLVALGLALSVVALGVREVPRRDRTLPVVAAAPRSLLAPAALASAPAVRVSEPAAPPAPALARRAPQPPDPRPRSRAVASSHERDEARVAVRCLSPSAGTAFEVPEGASAALCVTSEASDEGGFAATTTAPRAVLRRGGLRCVAPGREGAFPVRAQRYEADPEARGEGGAPVERWVLRCRTRGPAVLDGATRDDGPLGRAASLETPAPLEPSR